MEADEHRLKDSQTSTRARSIKGACVLVVEDDAIIAMMIDTMLEEAGAAEVKVAKSVAVASEMLANHRFDLAIFDRQLRDGLSYDIARIAKARGIAIIVSSGTAQLDLPEELLAVTILPKPFDSNELLSAVTKALLQA